MKNNMINRFFQIVATLLFLGLLVFPVQARAEDEPIEAGRFNYIQGSVVVQQEGSEDWFEAQLNYPVAPGDKVWANADSRAEIITYNGVVFRIGELTSLFLDAVSGNEDYRQASVTLPEGRLYVNSGPSSSNATVVVNMKGALIRSDGDSQYRVDTFNDGTIQIFARRGSVRVDSDQGGYEVREGELFNLVGGTRLEMSSLPPQDEFDQWNQSRDQGTVLAQTQYVQEYLPPEVNNVYPNLNSYGDWTYVDTYGYCWVPRVSVSWSPFYSGRWINWRNNYTWISYEPWGWVPYHYGRWAYGPNFGWFWVPPLRRSVYWCPGAVAWYQGYDSVYWLPLAPREYYYGYGYFGPYSVSAVNIHFSYFSGKVHHKNYRYKHGFVGAYRKDFYNGKNKYYGHDKFDDDRRKGKFAHTPYPDGDKMRRGDMPYRVARRSGRIPPDHAMDRDTWSRRSGVASATGGHRDDRSGRDNSQPSAHSRSAAVASNSPAAGSSYRSGSNGNRSGNEIVRGRPESGTDTRWSNRSAPGSDSSAARRGDASNRTTSVQTARPSPREAQTIRPSGNDSWTNSSPRRSQTVTGRSEPVLNQNRSSYENPASNRRTTPQPSVSGNNSYSGSRITSPSQSDSSGMSYSRSNPAPQVYTPSVPSGRSSSISRPSAPQTRTPAVQPRTNSSGSRSSFSSGSTVRGGSSGSTGRSYTTPSPASRERSSSGITNQRSGSGYSYNNYQSQRSASSGSAGQSSGIGAGGGSSSGGRSWGGMSGGAGRSSGHSSGGGRR